MRKSYRNTIALFFISATIVSGQNSINTVSPKIGDSVVVASVTFTSDQSADPGTAGTGKTWDFSSISPGPDISTLKYLSPVGKPGASYFPTATLASMTVSLTTGASSSISYASNSANGVNILGTYAPSSQGNMVTVYSDPMLQDFPNLAYNGTFSDQLAGTQSVEPEFLVYNITGNINYKYDAHGSLKYAYGTFSNVARINYTTTMTFTGAEDFEGFLTNSESQNYAYYDLTSKQALMAIITSTTSSSFSGFPAGSATVKRVILYKPAGITGLENETSTEKAVSVFPNPAVDKIRVNETFQSISIKDNHGSTLITKNLESGNEVSIAELDNGVYFAELFTSRGEKKCVKLVVNK